MIEKTNLIVPVTSTAPSFTAEELQHLHYTMCAYQCAILQFPEDIATPWSKVEAVLGAPASNKYPQGKRTAINDPERDTHIIFTLLPEDSQSFNEAGKRTSLLQPHTDSIQLSFMPNPQAEAFKREIPHFLLLKHWQHAATGGEAIHVPSSIIFEELAQQPETLKALQRSDAVICRIANQETIKSVIHTTETGFQLSFRDDDVGQMRPNPECPDAAHVEKGLDSIKKISRNPENQSHFLLNRNELLLTAHRAALHGVSAYENLYNPPFSRNSDYGFADITQGIVGQIRTTEAARIFNDTKLLPDSYLPPQESAAAEFLKQQRQH